MAISRIDISKKKLKTFKEHHPKAKIWSFKGNVIQILPKKLWRFIVIVPLNPVFFLIAAFIFVINAVSDVLTLFIEWYADFVYDYDIVVYGKIVEEREVELIFKEPE